MAGGSMASAKTKTGSPAVPEYRKSTIREYFESICVAVILALFVRTFVVQAYKIPTGSMENNLLIGDHLLVNKFVFAPTRTGLESSLLPIDPIRRGDIIVFKYPEDPNRDFVKRAIGLPGETVELRNRVVYIDGKPLEESYVRFLFPDAGATDRITDFDVRRNYGPGTLPTDHHFVIGEQRDNSNHTRYCTFTSRRYVNR